MCGFRIKHSGFEVPMHECASASSWMHCPGLGPALCFPASAAGTLQALTVQGRLDEVPSSLDEAVVHFQARRVRVGGQCAPNRMPSPFRSSHNDGDDV
eukprot:s2_g47.t1